MKVAAVQLNSTSEKATNLASAERHVRAAAAEGAELIVLPEKWTAMGGAAKLRVAAEPLDGPSTLWARSIASELAVDLVAGSIVEQEGESFANTCVHVGSGGEVKAVYRKIHMFDVEVAGHVYRESELERAGSEIVLSETSSGVPLGLSICYDLRFPELFRILALKGAKVMTLPSAFTLATTRDHWETLICARAIENQAFMIAANQVGRHPDDHESGGRSMIVDPWGRILGRLGGQEEGYVLADLDLEAQAEVRRRLPSLANRRPEAYRWPELGGVEVEAGTGEAGTAEAWTGEAWTGEAGTGEAGTAEAGTAVEVEAGTGEAAAA